MTRAALPDIGKNDPLVMTLLVRDEADIVEDNLRFHLSRGVSHVVAMDHASSDGTTEILERYAREGHLTLLREPSDAFHQFEWGQRMIDVVRERFSHAWVLPNDADEFWRPPDRADGSAGDLRESLRSATTRLVACNRTNLLAAWPVLADGDWRESLVWRPTIRVQPPRGTRLEAGGRVLHPLFFYRLPHKVIVHTDHLESVHVGAHHATFDPPESVCDLGIDIVHFPVRSIAEFERSVYSFHRAMVALNDRPAGMSSKYVRWGSMLHQGAPIKRVVSEALPTRRRARLYRSLGLLARDSRIRDDLAALDGTKERSTVRG